MGKKLSQIEEAILEMAADMREGGLIAQDTYEQITMRHLGPDARQAPAPLTAREIRKLRDSAHMSQAVFAQHLNRSTGQLFKLEREAEQASRTTLALLTVIQRK